MTEEEELELLELEVELSRSQDATDTPAEMSASRKVQGAGEQLNRGFLLGFGDEVSGGLRASMDMLSQPAPGMGGEEQSFGDRYRMYRDDARQAAGELEEAYPKSSLGLNVAGGLLSPVNKIAPGFGYGGKGGAAVARSVAEGGVVGLGESTGDTWQDMYSDAITGAQWAGGFNVGARTLGKVAGSTIFRRHITEPLKDAAGNFKPFHLAAEPGSLPATLYRQTIGRIPGAQQKLQRQERPYIEAATDAFEDAKEAVRRTGVEEELRHGAEKVRITDKAARQTARTSSGLEQATERAVQHADDVTSESSKRFREIAGLEAFPLHVREAAVEGLDLDNPDMVRNELSKWWTNEGFQEVKSQVFEFDEKLGKRITDRIAGDPDLALAFGDIMPRLRQMQARLGGTMPPGTDDLVPDEFVKEMLQSSKFMIDGEALMAMRNVFASGANGSSKNGWALRQIANEFDEFIRLQLPDAARDQFNDQISRYTKALAYMDATRTKAAREAGGAFTPSQYMGSAAKYGGKGMSSKTPPLEPHARAASRLSADMKKALPGRKKGLGKAAKRRKADIDAEKQAALALNDKQRGMVKQAAADAKAPGGSIYEAQTTVRDLGRRTVPDTTSGLSALLTADVAGGVIPGPRPPSRAVRVARGIGVGEVLASEGTQRMLAGQTQWQERARAALLRGDMEEYTRLLARMTAHQRVGE